MKVQLVSKCQLILDQGLPMHHQQSTDSRLVLMRAYEGMFKKYLREYPSWEKERAVGVWNDTMRGVTGQTYAFKMTTENLTRVIQFADIWIKEIKGVDHE